VPTSHRELVVSAQLPLIFAVGFTATMIVYLCVGIICSMYFGSYVRRARFVVALALSAAITHTLSARSGAQTKHIVTLNWVNWNGSFHITDTCVAPRPLALHH
jgi:uncharacterized membrane protein YciS (DUF1049 family)